MRTNNQNGKRSRGRGRRSNGFNQPNVNRNTTFESNGPEGKLRGNAQQLFEKYTALAQDANSSSERISAEAHPAKPPPIINAFFILKIIFFHKFY